MGVISVMPSPTINTNTLTLAFWIKDNGTTMGYATIFVKSGQSGTSP